MDINALLGKGSEFEGKLTFEGTVRIDGRFTGEIFSDGHLVVGDGAQVQAEIRVANVTVYGTINGNIHASESVELHAPASLRGNITSPALHIDKGVFFEGACQMSSRSGAGAPAPAPQAPPPKPSVRESQPLPSPASRSKISGLFQGDAPGRAPDLKHKF
ncbi:MAG: polymer-forming cytoskeletal protein [Myxococcales bacterium]|nr:polymer-forming cytoskeletal protein [Myxococcales bacterium]